MNSLQNLEVSYRRIDSLMVNLRNARTHSKPQVRKIADSIRAFGFTNPILIDRNAMIIAGHGRAEAAKLLGIEQAPTITLEDLTPSQIRAYVLADNRLAQDAGWDEQILKIELQNLVLDVEIDVALTGFEVAEIDLMLEDESNPDDELPLVPETIVSKSGDLWLLDQHRILCGDSRDDASFMTLMQGQKASVVFTDPPFNVAIEGHASGTTWL